MLCSSMAQLRVFAPRATLTQVTVIRALDVSHITAWNSCVSLILQPLVQLAVQAIK